MTPYRDRRFLLGVASLVATLAITLAWYLGYAPNLLEGEGTRYTAEFTSAQQLQVGDPVRVGGRKEGKVRRIEDRGNGRGALVTFDVDESVGPLHRDATAQLRWTSLLGASFYVAIDPGSSAAGDLPGKAIPRAQTRTQVELDDVTQVLDKDVRRGLARMPKELGTGLGDPDGLADLLAAVDDEARPLARGLRAVRGQRPGVDLPTTVRGVADTMAALDAPNDRLRALVVGAAGTLRTTAGRSAELRETLQRGPDVLDETRATLNRLEGTLTGADDLVSRLERSAGDVAPTLAALRPTLGAAARLLDRARPLLRALRPTATSLRSLARSGRPLIDEMRPSLDRLEKTIFPYLSRPDPETGKPTSTMIGGTAAGFSGAGAQQDENGHFIRFPASTGTSTPSVYLPCSSALVDPTKQQLVACDSLQSAFQEYLEYLPPTFQPGR